MKYLITGCSGKLGTYLCDKLPCLASPKKDLDILDIKQVEKFVSLNDIDAILHLAAVTDINLAEKERNLAYLVNVKGTANLAYYAKKFNKKIIYISTDYVFPCTEGGYKETDLPQPFNWYGFTKYAGELEIQNITDNYLIIRTSFRPIVWPFQTAYTNVFTSADYVDIIADEIILCLDQNLTGIIHVGTPAKTLYELAKRRNPDILPEEYQGNNKRRDLSIEKWEDIKSKLKQEKR